MTLLLSFPYIEQREGFDDDNYDDDHQERVEGEWRRAPRLGCSCRAERWRSRPAKQLSFSKYFRRSLKYVTNSSKSSRQMYQVNRTAWDRGLVSKAAMGDNLNKALWKLEIILENHHRQHAVPCSSSFIIIVDPISIFPKKSSSRWWPGPAEPLPSPQQPLCSSFPSQLRPVKSELIKIQYVLKLLANYYHDYHLVAINGMYSAVWKSARHGNAGKGKLVFANLWLSTLSWKSLTWDFLSPTWTRRFHSQDQEPLLPDQKYTFS